MTWIAEERVVFVFPDGTRRDGRIAVGIPVQREQDAQCPIGLDGLERTGPIFGATPLQALVLAVRFLGMRLHEFLSHGGRVLLPPGGRGQGRDVDARLDVLFGDLLRDPEPPQDRSGG